MEDLQLQNPKLNEEAKLKDFADSLNSNAKNNLTPFFQNSPLKGLNLDMERDKSRTRDSI